MAAARQWHRCTLVRGYGVASGQALDSPYPAGTISLQRPLFAARGLDLSGVHPGTLNLAFADTRWRLREPDVHIPDLCWTDRHPPETFSFWTAGLRWQGCSAPVEAWIYWPHPETKIRHHQNADRLELLAPWIAGIAQASGLELGVDPRRCRRIRPRALQARLLEALKFRVLASQDAFFSDFEQNGGLSMTAVRASLPQLLPQAADLDDDELALVLERARSLYCGGFGIGCNKPEARSRLS